MSEKSPTMPPNGDDVLRLLILSDVDIDAAIALAEKFVPTSPPPFDVIVVCGPLSHHELSSPETEAVATGDMASVIAHLENIVCRVIYLPGDTDPAKAAAEQLNLTPNSVNIHARSLPLSTGLCISGFTEKGVDLADVASCQQQDDDGEQEHEDEQEAGMQVQASSSAIAVQQVLSKSLVNCFPPPASVPSSALADTPPSSPCCGIFCFNYKYAHSLNHFLFFQAEVARQACLRLLVIPSFADSNFVFPREHNEYVIASPRSLRLEGRYTTTELRRPRGTSSSNSTDTDTGRVSTDWVVWDMQHHVLATTAASLAK
jgi:hypothetical protein